MKKRFLPAEVTRYLQLYDKAAFSHIVKSGFSVENTLKWLAEEIKCPECKGTGVIQPTPRLEQCWLWDGSGKIPRVLTPAFWEEGEAVK